MPHDKREEWEYQLHQPIPGQEDRVSDSVAEMEGEMFMAMMAQNEKNNQGG